MRIKCHVQASEQTIINATVLLLKASNGKAYLVVFNRARKNPRRWLVRSALPQPTILVFSVIAAVVKYNETLNRFSLLEVYFRDEFTIPKCKIIILYHAFT